MWYNLWSMKSKKSKKEKVNKEDSNKSLLTKYARKGDKEDADKSEGKGVNIPKTKVKKKASLTNIKQTKVFNNLFSGISNSKQTSMYKAMIDAGYSHSYARSCTQMTETKEWNLLIDKYLPDNLLATTHGDLMIARKLDYMLFTPEIKDEDIYEMLTSQGVMIKKIVHGVAGTHVWFFLPDNKIRKDATELGYKVKGKMAAEIIEVRKGLSAMSDVELSEVIKKQKNKFTKND